MHSFVTSERSLEAFESEVSTRPELSAERDLSAAVALRRELAPGLSATAGHLLLALRVDAATLAAALTIPLPASSAREQAEATFREHTRDLIASIERLTRIRWNQVDEDGAETLRRMFVALAKDLRAVVALLALRVEAMETGAAVLDDAQLRQLGRETLDVYAPLANRLGIWQLKLELENRALLLVDPVGYRRIVEQLSETEEERDAYVRTLIDTLKSHLAQSGVPVEITGRSKHVFSIYKKMQTKHVD